MLSEEEKNPIADNTEETPTSETTPQAPITAEATETAEEVAEIVEEAAEAVAEKAVEVTESVVEEVKETVEAAANVVVDAVALETTEEVVEDEEEVVVAPKILVKNVATGEDEEIDREEDTEIEEDDNSGATGAAHDDFDWTLSNRSRSLHTKAEKKEMVQAYEEAMTNIEESSIITAKVSQIIDGDVVLDLNFKSDGILALSEFRDTPELAVGDMVDVYVEQQEDDRGQLVLSRRKAKLLRAWDQIRDSYANGTVITGRIISKTKGGLIADCGGLETFLPGSQIDIKPIVDYDSYVGKKMEFKVVKINETIKNAVVSHKALIESDLAEQREAIIASLERGQVLEGVVKNLTDFGAFLDLGGVDGLLYITDISWGRINHPSEVLEINQKVNVAVLDFDENKKRISLGLKQLQAHPWDKSVEEIEENSSVKGKIVNIEDYGAFLEIEPGVEGLIHVSEVSWSNQPVNAREYFTLGAEYEAKVVTIDRADRKMSLSIKQMTQDPWDNITALFPIGSRHSGVVKNLTPYGVFVELNDGIGGMIHISDLSWTKRYSHPAEFTKVGQPIDVMVLEVDTENRKMSLGHKQTEENPWDSFETVFPEGSYHEATVIRKDDRGMIVQMPYGLEAYAPIKLMKKEDGTMADVDETLTVKVIEFNREDKRLMVSHSRYVNDVRREAKDSVVKERQEEQRETRQAISKTQSNVKQSTLGDLSAFEQLREQLSADDATSSNEEE